MQTLVRILVELLGALVYVALRNFKAVCLVLGALGFSILMYGLVSAHSPVPYPLLFILFGTLFIVGSWK
jgi:hypothetical protein